jgi:hypothetical protein
MSSSSVSPKKRGVPEGGLSKMQKHMEFMFGEMMSRFEDRCRTSAVSRRKTSTLICVIFYLSGKCGEIRNSCLLFMEKWNGSRHLVFWSLGTLTGLKDRVHGMVA